MLKGRLIHPDILFALGRAGHGSRILIGDGNYPFSTTLGKNARLVSLNLAPGIISATQALEALVSAIPVEAAAVMETAKTGPYAVKAEPPIWQEFRAILSRVGFSMEMEKIERFRFYEEAQSDETALLIATGEQRIYANILLTVGVILPT
jgi:L-fucose mutarotase